MTTVPTNLHAVAAPRRSHLSRRVNLPVLGASGPTLLDHSLITLARAAEAGSDVLRGFGFSREKSAAGVMAWLDRRSWPTAALRIGLGVATPWIDGILASPGQSNVMFFDARVGDPEEVLHDAWLDAVLHADRQGTLWISTPRRRGGEATWHDWSIEPPLAYLTMFPTRLDVSRVRVARPVMADAGVIRLLVECAATLSRKAHRIGACDRVAGRGRVHAGQEGWSGEDEALHLLSATLESCEGRIGQSEALAAAARVCGAWLATTEAPLDAEIRVEPSKVTTGFVSDEPQTLLRAAAVYCGARRGELALEAYTKAHAMLRRRAWVPADDAATLVHSELQYQAKSALGFGRVLAGAVVVCSGLAPDRIPFFRDDLLDDAEEMFTWEDREFEQRLMLELFSEMVRSRRAESAMPLAA